jgi:hypothetical protein
MMKTRMQSILWGILAAILIGCSPVFATDSVNPSNNGVVEQELQMVSATPNLKDVLVTSAPIEKDVVELALPVDTATPNPSEPPKDEPVISNLTLQNLVDQAKADLAERLSIHIDEINLVEARRVTWPDGSLGCPQPGRQYPQVLTAGYLVLLEANGIQFEYHGSENTIFYCNNPKSPVPGTPLDQ